MFRSELPADAALGCWMKTITYEDYNYNFYLVKDEDYQADAS